MKYTNFKIANYKGIKDLSLDLDIQPNHKIYTLVGLNESGKTTILEAINDFETEVPKEKRHLLIPKSAAGGFYGETSIKATLVLSEEDKEKIKKFINGKIKAKEIIIRDCFTLERTYTFQNSEPEESERLYSQFIRIKKTVKSRESDLDDDISGQVWSFIRKNLLPEVIFYRDFLSKFPEKIWLDSTDADKDKDKEYVSIIEDVLTSINPSYTVQSSLLDRLNNPNEANKQSLEAVENELGAKISQVVFDAWSKIQNVSKKEIVAKSGQNNDGRFYIKLSIKEGHQTYAISERSLGFRWFFTFLLYTEFRKERIKTSGEILFLLDEPASNLHQTAQKSLLETFANITTKSRLVYTTHSHHLINPVWLDATYIIKNNGLSLEKEEEFNSSKTEIDAYKYKSFVSNYPSQVAYFQPILDVLDYEPGLLEAVPNVVIVEGKFDYLTFKYFNEIVFGDVSNSCNFYPGRGASQLDLPISLYEAWGRNYVVILDADSEGKKQKTRYIKEISNESRIFTLEDADGAYKNCPTEKLFTKEEREYISKEFNQNLEGFEKGSFNAGIQILYFEKRVPEYLTQGTRERIKKVIEFAKSKLS